MISKAINFFRIPTSVNVIVNTAGTYLNVFFTAITALILVRTLTPAQYGQLSVLLGIAYVLANAFDFGITATIYSFLPPILQENSDQKFSFVKTTFYYQTLFASVILIILIIFFPNIDSSFLKTGVPNQTLYITAISTLFFIWQNYLSNLFYAAKKFLIVNVYINVANIVKTALLLVLIYFHQVSVGSVIFIFGIIGSLCFYIPLLFDQKHSIRPVLNALLKSHHLQAKYTLTYFISTQFFNLGQRMDLFLLSFFGLRNGVGYYGLAQKIILSIIAAIVSVTQVLSPLFSKVIKRQEVQKLIRPGLLYLTLPAVCFLFLYFIPDAVFEFFFTKRFFPAISVTKSLSLPFIIYTYTNLPLIFLLYTIKKPAYILVVNIIYFAIMLGGCYYLIPKLGIYAPAWVIGVVSIISGVLLTIISIYEYKKLPS